MSHLEEAGLKILRVWGFNDVNTKPGDSTVWFQYLSSSGSEINTGANGLQRLDWIVEAAENHGIKLIINFVNNWDDYGGMKAYTNAFGGDHAGWYTNTQAQAQYRKYIEAVISRYSDSSALFAWELANEPRCQGCDTGVIHEWATEISQYIKALDPNHLVTLGDEGFGLPGDGSYPYTYYEGVDWEKALTIDTLDFATFHLYPTSCEFAIYFAEFGPLTDGDCLLGSVSTDWGNGWIEAHAALCAKAGIPCFFEECKFLRRDIKRPKANTSDLDGMTYDQCAIESGWQDTSLAADGMAGDAFWQLGDTISTGQSHNDGNTIYYGSDVWTCLVTNHVADIPS